MSFWTACDDTTSVNVWDEEQLRHVLFQTSELYICGVEYVFPPTKVRIEPESLSKNPFFPKRVYHTHPNFYFPIRATIFQDISNST